MSGVEVLAGIGILCNAIQIVTFGKDALEVYNHVRENGTADPRLERYLADASKSYQEMRKQLSTSGPLTSDQQEVVEIGESAHNSLERFRTYFARLYVDENSRKGFRGRLRVVSSGIKTLFHTKELEELKKDFHRHQQLFQTRLIQRVCSQGDDTMLLTQESFINLNSTQRSIIKKIAEGHTEISLLVSKKAVEVKDNVTNQHRETRTVMGNYISITENNLRYQIGESTSIVQQDMASRHNTEQEVKKYDQLMASLRYPEMNSRRNQVIENFPETFQWVFSNNRPSNDESSSTQSYSSGEDTADELDTDNGIAPVGEDHNDNEGQSDVETYENSHEAPRSGRNQEDRIGELYDNGTASTASSSNDRTGFTDWLGSESGIFWISGKPGSGKSTLMKFIATNPATREHIAAWRSDVHILSHYFWKAGVPMERSMKGLLLSLTHQVLLNKITLTQRLLEYMPEVRLKWSHGDWDLKQLENTLIWALKGAGESFLLFIDGLDESEDFGRHLCMVPRNHNILDRFAELSGVKVCVSSREEYIFRREFEVADGLQIHKLTWHDIRQFANSRLKSLNFAGPMGRRMILRRIVKAADGVFLWVALVLDSISRAFRLDNSLDSIIERIERTPKDLIGLVREMWDRSGEDGDIPSYRASASRYFSLALASSESEGDISMLHMALASEEPSLEDMLDLHRTWDPVDLVKMCSMAERKLPLVCHGLLEVVVLHGRHQPLPKLLECYGEMGIRFTHRCVIDFLRCTEDGSALLNTCEWSQGEAMARIIGASLVSNSLNAPESARPLTLKYDEEFYELATAKKRYSLQPSHSNHVEVLLRKSTEPTIPPLYRGFFLQNSYEWYMADLFRNLVSWHHPQRSMFREERLKGYFIASMANSASPYIMDKLIAALSTQDFLDSLPAVFRGLSSRLSFRSYACDELIHNIWTS